MVKKRKPFTGLKRKGSNVDLKKTKTHVLYCKECGAPVTCSVEAVAITCGRCTVMWVPWPKYETEEEKAKRLEGFPRGWHLKKVFVHENGRVFHKGKEQPELKDTLEPTKIKPQKKRKTKQERESEKLAEFQRSKHEEEKWNTAKDVLKDKNTISVKTLLEMTDIEENNKNLTRARKLKKQIKNNLFF